jgi:spore maturation protein CgeB
MWKILGSGGFYLGRHIEGIETFATGGEHCAWYRDSVDAAELTQYYLARPSDRERIAKAGRSHALAHHTYAHRLALLLQGKSYPLPTIL